MRGQPIAGQPLGDIQAHLYDVAISDTVAVTDGVLAGFGLPSVSNALQLWLRADLGTTIATGVSQWNDQSQIGDSNRNVVQATGGQQPTLNSSDATYNNRASTQPI